MKRSTVGAQTLKRAPIAMNKIAHHSKSEIVYFPSDPHRR